MSEALFERELEIFRTEVESAVQFFYAYLAVHAVAAENKLVHRLLNTAPLFWNTNLGALQTAAFIALGRVFDQQAKSEHNVDKLIRLAQDNLQIFSREALARRKQGSASSPPEWLGEYMRAVYVPGADDFRTLRRHIKALRKVYESNYRDLRNCFFAHKEVSNEVEVQALFSKTNIDEMKCMLSFLSSLYSALWNLFFNGHKPDLSSPIDGFSLTKRITSEAEKFLLLAATSSATVDH